MAIKDGRYDRLCLEVLEKSRGRAVVVIVVQGHGISGTGVAVREEFSVAGGEYHVKRLPKLLRQIADQIEKERNGNHSKT